MRFYISIFIIFIFSSCNNNKDEELRVQVQTQIAKDIRVIASKSLDQMTIGIGSSLLSAIVSKDDQDNFLSKPLMPYINEVLNTKNTHELTLLANGPTSARLKLVGECIYNNKEVIIKNIKESSEFVGPLSDDIMNDMIIQINKSIDDK